MQNDENTNSANASGTTASSTGDSTPGSSAVQPMEVPPVNASESDEKEGWRPWSLEELRKVKRTKKTVMANYKMFKAKRGFSEKKHASAAKYFETEWPGRSPYSVYQKTHLLAKKQKIILV